MNIIICTCKSEKQAEEFSLKLSLEAFQEHTFKVANEGKDIHLMDIENSSFYRKDRALLDNISWHQEIAAEMRGYFRGFEKANELGSKMAKEV